MCVQTFLLSLSPSVLHFMCVILHVKLFLLSSPIRFCRFCSFLCWFFTHLLSREFPSSNHRAPCQKAIDNHTTPFCCRLRPIRANHCTVGVVLAVSFCLVCGCFSWRGRPAVSLPACLPTQALPSPWLCLAVLALKGRRRTIGFTQLSTTQFESALISQTWMIDTTALQGLFLSVAVSKAGNQIVSQSTSYWQVSATASYVLGRGHTEAIVPSKRSIYLEVQSLFIWFKS